MNKLVFILVFLFTFNLFAAGGMFMVVKGDVKLTTKDLMAQPAKVGTKVNQGDLIITGVDSRAKIVMSDRNIINIAPSTKLKIEEYIFDGKSKNVKLSLLEGKVRNNVEQKYDNDKNKFEVRTPTAVAGVRGTQFITSYSEETKKTEVITLQGQVEFKNRVAASSGQTEQAVIIEKGEKSSVGEGSAPPEPPQKVPPEVLKEVDRSSAVKNKEAPSATENANQPAVPVVGTRPVPTQDKPPLVDGAIQNKFDKTKVKVEPKPPSGS